MRAFASSARHGTKGERVALVSGASKGDDPSSSVSLAETSSRAARASILLGALAALAALAVVAVVGVTSTSSLGSLLAPAALGQSGVPDDEIPEGIGYTGVGGQSTTTACAMAAEFCNLELFNDYMYKCCELSNDATVQQDCLCHPIDYGFDETMTDNVGTNATDAAPPELGAARRMGNFAKARADTGAARLGRFQSPGCDVEGYCAGDSEEHVDDALFAVCCENFADSREQNACLCEPMKYLV